MSENFGAFVRRVRDTGVVQLPITVLDCSANPNYPAASAGDVYRVTGAGRVGGGAGPKVEVGDVLVCHTDSAAGDHAAVGLNWIAQQTNLDPATFEAVVNKSTDVEVDGASDVKYPSVKAVKDYVDESAGAGGVTNSAAEHVLPKSDAEGNLIASRFADDGDDVNVIVEAVLLRLRGITDDAFLGHLTGTRVSLSTDARLVGGDTNNTQVIVDDDEETIELYAGNGIKTLSLRIVENGNGDPTLELIGGGAELCLPLKVRAGDTGATGQGTVFEVDDAGQQIILTALNSIINSDLAVDGAVSMTGLPTVNPNEAGALWNDAGTLKISAG